VTEQNLFPIDLSRIPMPDAATQAALAASTDKAVDLLLELAKSVGIVERAPYAGERKPYRAFGTARQGGYSARCVQELVRKEWLFEDGPERWRLTDSGAAAAYAVLLAATVRSLAASGGGTR